MITNLFNENYLKQRISEEFSIDDKKKYDEKKDIIKKWVTRIEDGTLNYLNEVQLQGEFIRDIFSSILDAKDFLQGTDEWNIIREEKTKVDGTKADAILGYFNNNKKDYRVAIELKGPKVHLDVKQKRQGDNRTPVEQGFSYLPKYGKNCGWLIVSNYKEIRLYNRTDSSEYEAFRLIDLLEDQEFIKFLYLLSFNTLVSKDAKPKIEKLYEENIEKEQEIENNFYKLYTNTRDRLFDSILNYNEGITARFALEKTQKLIDRFIFVCFAEDRTLLPKNIFHEAVEHGKGNFSTYGVWENVRGLFNSIDKGNQNKGINKFNGGLFRKDPELDNLIIPNEIFDQLEEIAAYDFNSDLNVNILGHIFEQSISDLEEIKANIDGEEFDIKKGKRKRDGIFYTPSDITQYIVENTVGTYLSSKRKELGENTLPKLNESDFKITRLKNGKIRYTKNLLIHIKFWEDYREIVSNVKILDPACGSGAFLNQVFDYLYNVGKEINDTLENYTGMPSLFDLDRNILQNNIYGVDLNKESIEITKLSLWLKTANKYKELTTLDNNIKCGNSLIPVDNVSPNNYFNWEDEFKEVIEAGGFDVIIGNPPYVRNTNLKNIEKDYYSKTYLSAQGQYDLYVLFNELGIKLLKTDGLIGYIQPNKFLSSDYGVTLLSLIEETCEILKIKNVSQDKVFQGASVYPYIFIFKKIKEIPLSIEVKKKDLFDLCPPSKLINFDEEIRSRDIIKIISENSLTLSNFTEKVTRGLPNNKIDIVDYSEYKAVKSTTLKFPFYMPPEFVEFKYKHENYFKEKEKEFSKSPVMLPRTVKKIRAILNEEKIHILDRIYYFSVQNNSQYNAVQITALLNSNVITFYYNYKYGNTKIGGGYFDLKGTQIKELPLPTNLSNEEKEQLEILSEKLRNAYKEFESTINKFKNRLNSNLNITKFSSKIDNFHQMNFSDFMKELKKNKITFTLRQQDEWEDYFVDKKNSCQISLNKIKILERDLNTLVYRYYNFSNDDIVIIEEVIESLVYN